MLRKIENFVTLVVCLLVLSQLGHTQNPSYTLDQLTKNNTAACSSNTYGLLGTTYCADVFPGTNWGNGQITGGWQDDQQVMSGSQILTLYHDPTPAGDPNVNGANLWNIGKG